MPIAIPTLNPQLACPNPVFIVGAPRSGTTILAWSLAQHSSFWTSDESKFLWELFGNGTLDKNYARAGQNDGSWLTKMGIDKRNFRAFIGIGINMLFTRQSGGKRWVDQTPSYTLLGTILLDMFPGARFVHILRDGRSVVHSMINYRHKTPKWAKDFGDACRTWKQYVAAAMELAQADPARCYTITNEDLSSAPDRTFAGLLQFLGEQHEEGPALYCRNNRINSSFGRNKTHPKAWEDWTDSQRELFVTECGDCDEKYGSFFRTINSVHAC